MTIDFQVLKQPCITKVKKNSFHVPLDLNYFVLFRSFIPTFIKSLAYI